MQERIKINKIGAKKYWKPEDDQKLEYNRRVLVILSKLETLFPVTAWNQAHTGRATGN